MIMTNNNYLAIFEKKLYKEANKFLVKMISTIRFFNRFYIFDLFFFSVKKLNMPSEFLPDIEENILIAIINQYLLKSKFTHGFVSILKKIQFNTFKLLCLNNN